MVNSEFTLAEATTEANLFGKAIGNIPRSLRTSVSTVTIHKGTNPFGGGN